MVFGNFKRIRKSSVTKAILLPDPPSTPRREVPRADRFMKIYINHPQTICIHPVKWGLEIPSHLGGVRRQYTLRQTCDGQTDML